MKPVDDFAVKHSCVSTLQSVLLKVKYVSLYLTTCYVEMNYIRAVLWSVFAAMTPHAASTPELWTQHLLVCVYKNLLLIIVASYDIWVLGSENQLHHD